MLDRLGIRSRVLLLALLPAGLMALVLGSYFTWLQQNDLRTQLLQRGKMIAEQLAPLAAPAMARLAPAQLERIAAQTLEQADVRAVAFLAPDRTRLAHAGPSMLNLPPSGGTGTQLLQRSGNDATRYLMPVFGHHRDLATDAVPAEAERLLGWVEIELSHDGTLLRGYRNLFTSLLLILACLALSGLLALRMSRTINDPIERIKHAVNQLKDGHLEERLPTMGSHELDELAHGINRMAETLQNAHEELQHSIDQATEDVRQNLETIEIQNIELDMARKEALEASRIKSEFLANMSHEIRTPLNGMLGMIALALDNPLPSEQRQQLAIAHDSGKVLVELLNDILDLSKFDAGQLELERIAFDMGSMVEDTANLLSQNTAQSVELTCLIASDFPSSVLGDPTRVRQIVSNLLSNALKFTRFGRVDVRLAAIVGGVRLEVRDTGIGIPEDAQARIFQPFTQAGAGITRQYGGTGLGLALTRNLCKAMQGHLHIRSEPGFGSCFTAELPLTVHTEAIPPAPLHGRVAALSAAGSGLNELLQHLLPAWGLTYQRHDSCATLVAAVIDLLITDDVEHLFELRPALKTPILLVTAYGNFLPNEQSLALAPLHQLARPLARNALYQTLRRTLQGHEPEHPLAIPAITQEQGRARILLVEDNPVNQLVAKGMLAKLGCQVQLATQGAEALELLAREEFDLVLMDCNMPVMDGYEASRRIRQSGRWPELPIVALTANAMPEERERCRAAGMNDYLAKPFRREELLALVDHWVPFSG